MQAITLGWDQLALLAATYALVGMAGVFVGALWVARPRQGKVSVVEPHSLGDELSTLRREVESLKSQLESTSNKVPSPPVESAYSQAIKLAQQGLDSAAVAAGCGISRGEADLIVAIYLASQRP